MDITGKYRSLKKDDGDITKGNFPSDVDAGLSKTSKSISSKYLYDAEGDRLFQQIMELPEYYLTRCEYEILQNNRDKILSAVGDGPINLVELGAGDGKKTVLLLEHFLEKGLQFRYVPIDISEAAICGLVESCCDCYPDMAIEGLVAEYFSGIKWLADQNHKRNLVLFLGSNIGNFARAEMDLFLRGLWDALNNGDFVLIGFDLKKDVGRIVAAYDDARKVTAQFNINLLRRINRELGGSFDLDQFEHHCTYNEELGAIESYLVSSKKQDVQIEVLGKTFTFDEKEPLHVEYSHKFSSDDIVSMAERAGFKIIDQFYDSGRLFVDSLWQVVK